MTVDEKIRVIRNWSDSFKICPANNKQQYGLLVFWGVVGTYMGPCPTRILVFHETYDYIYEKVWNQVNYDH